MSNTHQRKKKFTATVSEVEQLTPGIRRLQLSNPAIADLDWQAGDKLKLQTGEKVKRSYTPSAVDQEGQTLDVVIRLHGQGPFARWAAGCKPGDPVRVKGPKSSMRGPNGDETWAMLFGDATTLGLARALSDSLPPGVELSGAIELATPDLHATDELGLGAIDAVAYGKRRGDALLAWLNAKPLPEGPGTVWISGHKPTAYSVKRALASRGGVSSDRIRLKGYWD